MHQTTSSTNTRRAVDTSTIPGWGVDADPANNPTYPYRDRSKDDHSGTWKRPLQQETEVEILQSIEHKQRPAVVGTSMPPSGLSGVLRRAAFRKSESNLLHWILLLAADRINVVEGMARDFGRARLPNISAESGVRPDWRHDKRGLAMKAAVVVGAIAIIGIAVAKAKDSRQPWR
jgi:hypothetical protein